jgi:hypothetical protein
MTATVLSYLTLEQSQLFTISCEDNIGNTSYLQALSQTATTAVYINMWEYRKSSSAAEAVVIRVVVSIDATWSPVESGSVRCNCVHSAALQGMTSHTVSQVETTTFECIEVVLALTAASLLQRCIRCGYYSLSLQF